MAILPRDSPDPTSRSGDVIHPGSKYETMYGLDLEVAVVRNDGLAGNCRPTWHCERHTTDQPC